MEIKVTDHWKGRGTPVAMGRIVARCALANIGATWDLTVDLRGAPTALLISGFFHGFLQQVHDQEAPRLGGARTTVWLTDHDFQQETAIGCVRHFKPRN